MKYAVLKTGGKQYRVSEGQILEIEKIDKKPKEKVEFEEVFLVVDGETKKIGQSKVEGAKVEAEVLEQIKGDKITVAKFKAKVRYHKKQGHRQKLTRVKIDKIVHTLESKVRENATKGKRPRKTTKKS